MFKRNPVPRFQIFMVEKYIDIELIIQLLSFIATGILSTDR